MKRAKLDHSRTSSMSDDPEDEEDSLRLTLGPPGSSRSSQSSQYHHLRQHQQLSQSKEEERYRPRRTPVRTPPPSSSSERSAAPLKKKGLHIQPPFPWSTEYRAKNYSLEWILHLGITSIRGEVQCKRCDGMTTVEVSLEATFAQLDRYFMENKHSLHDRAPKHWMVPRLLDCTLCHQSDCVKPIVAEKKREINWLFLLLTQTLGLCTLDQLKFFCKHNDKHRTGAKDRVLYSTYGGLLKQLNPAAGEVKPVGSHGSLSLLFVLEICLARTFRYFGIGKVQQIGFEHPLMFASIAYGESPHTGFWKICSLCICTHTNRVKPHTSVLLGDLNSFNQPLLVWKELQKHENKWGNLNIVFSLTMLCLGFETLQISS